MIEPDRAGILHRCAQDFAERRATGFDQFERIDAGQAPALALRVERVRRCADLDLRQVEILLVPGVEAVRPDADREVEIEPDRKPRVTRAIAAGSELLIGDPLHVLDKGKLVGVLGSQTGKCVLIGLAPFIGPFPPGMFEAPAQQFECGEGRKPWSALALERIELLPAPSLPCE